MGKLKPRDFLRILFLIVALLCWYRALLLTGDMLKSSESLSFRYGSGGVPYTAIEEMLEDEQLSFAAWRQQSSQNVTEQEFWRDAPVQVLEVTGDAGLILPSTKLLHGFLPARASMDICAIDTATAYALWGSANVTGEVLLYGGKEYTVTGVFSQPENTVLLGARPENDAVFPYLELSISDSVIIRHPADELRARHAIPEPDIVIDNAEAAAIMRQLTLLPALLVSALLLWHILLCVFGKPVSLFGRLCYMLVIIADVVMIAWAVGFAPILPASTIPGRISDFSFWAGLVDTFAEQERLIRIYGQPAPDFLRWQEHRSVLAYLGIALTGFMLVLPRSCGVQQNTHTLLKP